MKDNHTILELPFLTHELCADPKCYKCIETRPVGMSKMRKEVYLLEIELCKRRSKMLEIIEAQLTSGGRNEMNFGFSILDEKEYKIIPVNCCPTKMYTFIFQGWECYSIDFTDKILEIITNVSYATLQSFLYSYKETHAFTQPEYTIKFDGNFLMRIGTMENERYLEIMEAKLGNGK